MRHFVATIRVVLADDNEALLKEISAMLAQEFDIVGTAKDGEGTIGAVQRADPDVVVLDISMPKLNGIEVATRLHDSGCRAKIVFLTIHEQPSYISAAFSTGGSAYVTKRHMARDLVPAVRAAFEGQTYVSPSLRR
jgi:DNA-binding NarL/FixJ family response regulator